MAYYQVKVPVREYLDFRPLWGRALDGASDVTWPGRPRHWVKTSGTTAGDKAIPVTPQAFDGLDLSAHGSIDLEDDLPESLARLEDAVGLLRFP